MGPARQTEAQVFEKHVIRKDGCWCWRGAKSAFGYGVMRASGVTDVAHRVSYRLAKGSIPAQLCVMHVCDNPECTNPDHLTLGTQQQNQADKVAKQRQYRGERHHQFGKRSWRAMLNDESEAEAKRLLAGGSSRKEVAAALGVTAKVIRTVAENMARA